MGFLGLGRTPWNCSMVAVSGIEEVDITGFLAFGSTFGSRSCMWFDRPSYILKNGTFDLLHCFWVIASEVTIREYRTVPIESFEDSE